jgi:putative transposase
VRSGAIGFPHRKKHGARRSCRFTTGAIRVLDAGRARVLSATISESAGRWFVSFTCMVERVDSPARLPLAVVGVDLGVKHLATLSTGEFVPNPKALGRHQRKLALLGRELARRQKGSKRRGQTKAKLGRTHVRVTNVRRDALHKVTSELTSNYGTVVLEDLNVAGMTRAPKPVPNGAGGHARNGRRAKAGLNRVVRDASFAELRRQLTYKLVWRGGNLVVADRFFASSKT